MVNFWKKIPIKVSRKLVSYCHRDLELITKYLLYIIHTLKLHTDSKHSVNIKGHFAVVTAVENCHKSIKIRKHFGIFIY